jgi:hypothetical protein
MVVMTLRTDGNHRCRARCLAPHLLGHRDEDRKLPIALAKLRTRLNPFSDREQEQLINWGYALADAAVRNHVPQIVTNPPLAKWPCPAHPLS